MRRSKSFMWFSAACALATAGCGGSGGGGGGGGTNIAALLANGRAAFKVLSAKPSATRTSADYKTVLDAYAAAYAADSTNEQARALYAAFLAAYNGKLYVECTGITIPVITPRGGQLGTGSVITDVIDQASASAAANPTRVVDPATFAACAQAFYTSLKTSVGLLDAVAADSTFSYTIDSPRPTDSAAAATATIDQADLQVLDAAIHGGLGYVEILYAYNLNWGTFDFSRTLSTAFPGAATLGPSQFLPSNGFLTYNTSTGPGLLASARTDLSAAYTTGLAADTSLQGRTDKKNHLLDSTNITAAQYQSGAAVLQGLNQSLSGPVTIPIKDPSGNPTSLTLNINAWLTNPPASLVALAPTWTLQGNSYVVGPASYPDKTFGGLLPGGPPAFALTDSVLTTQTVGNLAVNGFPFSGFIKGLVTGGGSR